MAGDGYLPLFETRRAKEIIFYRVFAVSVFVCIFLIWVYRLSHIPHERDHQDGRVTLWVWIGLFAAELWFGFYWILTQALRWNRVRRQTFRNRLSQRYESELPGVDIFVCTADPKIEPPLMVINTVLSVMAFDYPTDKLSVYLSDDAGSDLTFYALMEASHFRIICGKSINQGCATDFWSENDHKVGKSSLFTLQEPSKLLLA